jgi:hypothetical protein
MSPYQHGIRLGTTAQGMQAEALLAFLGLLVKPAIQPNASFPALDGCSLGCIFLQESSGFLRFLFLCVFFTGITIPVQP